MSKDAFSDWLTGRMERKGWNQSDLSSRSGIHKANISAWIRGRNRPSPEQIVTLADALDASVEEAFRVLGWFDAPTPLTPAQADLIETIKRRNISDSTARTHAGLESIADQLRTVAGGAPDKLAVIMRNNGIAVQLHDGGVRIVWPDRLRPFFEE